jgi:hypothetical protein
MGKRKYSIIATALILCAIFCDGIAKSFCSRSTHVLAKSIANPSTSEAEKAAALTERDRLAETGRVFSLISLGLAILSAAIWYTAIRRHEPVWHFLLGVLFVSWCLFQFTVT